jgi:serine/threonine-protein kinase HipA
MNSLHLYVGQLHAGTLLREVGGFVFRYADDYVGAPVFLNWPVQRAARHWQDLPAELACLLPEGLQLDQWRDSGATDIGDWALLTAMGADLPGMISALPSHVAAAPSCREATGQKRLNRARILPKMDALPCTASDLAEFNSHVGFTYSLASSGASANAIYSRKESAFKLVKTNGSYRLTSEPKESPESIENQLLTARLAHDAGLSVVPVGLVQTTDGVPVLWAERFDRSGASNCQRARVESACQLLSLTPADKYDGSVEAVARLIRQYCTNPKIQLMRLFHRVLFGWLTGNSTLHLKKWSILQNGSIVELSPAYSLINSAILGYDTTESALLINDRREGLDRGNLLEYLAKEVCGLNDRVIARAMKQLGAVAWEQRILESGLSRGGQRAYFELLSERWRRLH